MQEKLWNGTYEPRRKIQIMEKIKHNKFGRNEQSYMTNISLSISAVIINVCEIYL
jgi:hypothetical protein